MNASPRYVFGVGDAVQFPQGMKTPEPDQRYSILPTNQPPPLLKPDGVTNYVTLLGNAPAFTTGLPTPQVALQPPASWPGNVSPTVATNIVPMKVIGEATPEAREQVYAALNPDRKPEPTKTNWLIVAALALGTYYMLTDS